MSSLHVFIAGSRALGEQLMGEIASALSPIYTFSYNIEFNSDTAKELEDSVISVVVCSKEEEEREQIGTKIACSIESQYNNVDIVQWDPETGASTLRLILDTMMLRYINMVRESRGEPPLEKMGIENRSGSDNEQDSNLINNIVHCEDGTIDIDATNLKIKSYGFRITRYADGRAHRMGYIFRPLEKEEEGEESEEPTSGTLEEPEKDDPVVEATICSFSGCHL